MTSQEFNAKVVENPHTIFNYCMRKTATREDAEDLSQDTLLALSRSLPNLQNDDSFYGFMWGVVYERSSRRFSHHRLCRRGLLGESPPLAAHDGASPQSPGFE